MENIAPEILPRELPPQPRQGFSPLLVLSTIAVVLFVLWFCPQAIFWAWEWGK